MDNTIVHITSELLDNLEQTNNLLELSTEEEFFNALKLERAIIYILVDWSGPERVSRYNVYKALNTIDDNAPPVYKIDCSDQTKQYVIKWLITQRENKKDFYYGGWGETLLLRKGSIIDYIKNPGQLGQNKTKEKLVEWRKHLK